MHYHRFAGQSVERLAALSDGIFAVAMTLLVLDLRVPMGNALHSQEPLWASGALSSEQVVWGVLVKLGPSVLTFLTGFLTLGMFWVGQQTQLNHLATSDRSLTWIHLAFLTAVALMPFSTALLSQYITYRFAVVVYWLNLLLLGIVLLVGWRYAVGAGLIREETPTEVGVAIERRIVVVQFLYAAGALLCLTNNYVSIVFIVLVQLNSAVAPRIFPLDRY